MTADNATPIRLVIGRAARRLRVDRMVMGAVTAGIPAALLLAATLLADRLRGLPPHGLQWALAAAAALPLAGALWGILAPIDRRRLATRVDSSSTLHDRLGTAFAITGGFRRDPATPFQAAAVSDAARHAPSADPVSAIPIRVPGTARALLLALIAAAAAELFVIQEPPGYPPIPPRMAASLVPPEELEPQRDAIEDLHRQADNLDDARLAEIAEQIAKLVDRIEHGEIDRKGAFEKLHALEGKLGEGLETADAQERAANAALKEAARELDKALAKAKGKLGKARDEAKKLADALAKKDLAAARKAMEQLARMLEHAPLPRGVLAQLAKMFEKTADRLAKKFDASLRKELSKEIERLRELLRKQGLSERERERMASLEKRMQQAKESAGAPPQGARPESPERQGARPQEHQAQGKREGEGAPPQKQAGMSRAVNRLSRQMDQASKQMQNAARQQQGDQRQAQKQASEAMQRGSQEMKALHRGMRQQQARRQARDRLSDLKESLRRQAGQQKMAQRRRSFDQRASGRSRREQEGGKASKPGGGPPGKPGRGQAKLSRRGKGDGIGNAPDPGGRGRSERGRRTKTQDRFVAGLENEGPTNEEVVLDVAQKGFAAADYRRVHARYSDVAEEELSRGRIPAGYRYYVKRYFQLIRPREVDEGDSP